MSGAGTCPEGGVADPDEEVETAIHPALEADDTMIATPPRVPIATSNMPPLAFEAAPTVVDGDDDPGGASAVTVDCSPSQFSPAPSRFSPVQPPDADHVDRPSGHRPPEQFAPSQFSSPARSRFSPVQPPDSDRVDRPSGHRPPEQFAPSQFSADAPDRASDRPPSDNLDDSADELLVALERGLVVVERDPRTESIDLDDEDVDVDTLLGGLERELRTSGALSFATCETLRADHRLRGLELCLAFLRCTVFAGDASVHPIMRRRRVHTCRLLLLSIGAHTASPRWSTFQVEQMLEAALSIPGAELSDLVQALFALLVDTRDATSYAQASFIRELAAHVTGKRRRGHSADDFVWIAVRLADPCFPATEAQAFLAAHVLPWRMRDSARETITTAVRSSALADEVAHILGSRG